MNTFFGQTFVCLIVMLKNKTRAIEDINISIALVDSWVRPLIGQCKLNDIGRFRTWCTGCGGEQASDRHERQAAHGPR